MQDVNKAYQSSSINTLAPFYTALEKTAVHLVTAGEDEAQDRIKKATEKGTNCRCEFGNIRNQRGFIFGFLICTHGAGHGSMH